MASKAQQVKASVTPDSVDVAPQDDKDAPEWATQLVSQSVEPSRAQTVDAVVVDADARAAMTRAANYVNTRGYGPKMTQVISYISVNAVDTMALNVVVMELLADRILNAESPDDILDPFGTIAGANLYETPLNIQGVQFIESTQGEGFPWYAALSVLDPMSGEVKTVTVGGEKLVPQVAGFDMANAWPQVLVIHQSDKATSNGYRVLELKRAV